MDKETQKHCALKGSQTLEDYYLAAIEFEKISQIGEEVDQQQSLAVEARLEQNKINEAYNVNYNAGNQGQRNYTENNNNQNKNFNNNYGNNNNRR